MAEPGVQAAAAISVGQAVTVYSLFLPPLTEVRRATSNDPMVRADVRTGQLGAAIVVVSIGMILSSMTNSQLPFAISVLMSAVIAAVYEFAMRNNGSGEQNAR